MLAFALTIALFLMILPAVLSVIFVTSSPQLLFWNLSWYALMGFFGSVALGTPWGWGFGLIPAVIYMRRFLTVKRSGKSTVTFSHYRMRARPQQSSPSRNESVVIEAEFTKDSDTSA